MRDIRLASLEEAACSFQETPNAKMLIDEHPKATLGFIQWQLTETMSSLYCLQHTLFIGAMEKVNTGHGLKELVITICHLQG
jgi:hypothetical protein